MQNMQDAVVLLSVRCPDPKLAKAALAPFHSAADGTTTTSASGFALLHEGQPLVITSAAALLPAIKQQRRQSGSMSCTTSSDLAPGAQLAAVLSSNSAGGSSSSSNQSVPLRLLGLAELPGVRQSLLQLLEAPSIAGPAGWQLGWLLHRVENTQPQQQQGLDRSAASIGAPASRSVAGGAGARPVPSHAAVILEAACHIAVLQPATPAGADALRRIALPWPAPATSSSARSSGSGCAALQPGRALVAAGAPFGALEPRHFSGFVAAGVLSAAVPNAAAHDSRSAGAHGTERRQQALLLSDMRCVPGMEGGPVFAVAPPGPCCMAAGSQQAGQPGAQQQAGQLATQHHQQQLVGMLLPPLKAPAAQVEFAAIAPTPAVAAAALQVLGPASQLPADINGASSGLSELSIHASGSSDLVLPAGSSSGRPRPKEPLADALRGVVAVAAGGAWATGVVVSSAGHILTNAHLLHPPAPAAGGSRQLQLLPAAAGTAAPVQVLLPAAPAGGGASGRWAAADVLYVFQGPLDLAVLQLRQPWRRRQRQEAQGWRPVQLATQQPRAGQPVCVAGFPALNPRSSPLTGPVVTSGNLAKVVALPSSGRAAMLLTTAAVHSGASGGALLDAATGRLLGIITSNAKHTPSRGPAGGTRGGGNGNSGGSSSSSSSGAGGHTVIPHLNFSIPAEQLAHVVSAAQAPAAAPEEGPAESAAAERGGSSGAGGAAAAAALAAWQALDSVAAADAELVQVWRLDRHRQQHQQQKKQQQQQQHKQTQQGNGDSPAGGSPPAKLQALMQKLHQQQLGPPTSMQQRSRL